MNWILHHGDCLDVMRGLPDASIDAVVTDPPYPEVDRAYGRMSVGAWETLMHALVCECRRVLTATGSAVFVLQPNSERVGSLRPWLFDFVSWCCREWNVVQDLWWWNYASPPTVHVAAGLLRPSLKMCVWVGPQTSYRNGDSIRWTESDAMNALRLSSRAERVSRPSGFSMNTSTFGDTGTSSAFNVFPVTNTNSTAAGGHPGATPLPLVRNLVRLVTPAGGLVLDPFAGSGSTGVACAEEGFRFVGIEREAEYHAIATKRLEAAYRQGRLDL